MNTKTYAGRLTTRFFLCSKSAYTKNLILDGLFSENVTVKILQFFRLLSFLCITVKSRSKWEKLSLKTLIIPRVRLSIEFGSFFIYATNLPFFVDFGDCDFNSHGTVGKIVSIFGTITRGKITNEFILVILAFCRYTFSFVRN